MEDDFILNTTMSNTTMPKSLIPNNSIPNPIADEFYRLLADDYIMDGTASVIYRHYLSEIQESIRKYEADIQNGIAPKKISAIDSITLEYQKLGSSPSEELLFRFLTTSFGLFGKQPILYDHALYVYAPNVDDDLDGTAKNMGKLNDRQDFMAILNVLRPFLSAGLSLHDADWEALVSKCKKSLLRQRVAELADAFAGSPEQLKGAFTKAGLLTPKHPEIQRLYSHALSRSIDKAFKDYLYSCGYYMYRPSMAENISIRKTDKGRSNAKPDKTLKLLAAICLKKGVQSLTPNDIDSPEFARFAEQLFTEISAQMYARGRDASLSLVLDTDAKTGNSLHLLGRHYFGALLDPKHAPSGLSKPDAPCAFAIINRQAGEDVFSYEAYSPYNDDPNAPLLYDDFQTAKREYKLLSAEAAEDILDQNTKHTRRWQLSPNIMAAFGHNLPQPAEAEEALRRETLEYIAAPYLDE